MPLNYSDSDLDLGPAANSNTAGVADVSPEHAVSSLNNEFLAGVPAAAGMRDPVYGAGLAQTAQQQAVVASSPPVRTWAATAPPAHLAVTKDDFAGLAKVAKSVGDYLSYVNGNPLEDLAAGFTGLGQDVINNAKALIDTSKPVSLKEQWDKTLAFGKLALDVSPLGVIGAALSPVTETLARAQAPFITQTNPIFPWEAAKVLTTPEEKLQEARRNVSVALLGSGGVEGEGAAAAPHEGPIPAEPSTAPKGPLLLKGPKVLAEQDVAAAEQAQQLLAETKTLPRSQAVAQTFLEQQTPNKTVDIDIDKLMELKAQGHEPFLFPGLNFSDALLNGDTTVKVPYSEYLAATAGQPFADDLNKATSFSGSNGMSLNEVAEAGNGMVEAPEAQAIPKTAPPAPPEDFSPEEQELAKNVAAKVDTAVDRIVQQNQIYKLFQDPAAAGMTKPQFELYGEKLDKFIDETRQLLYQRAYTNIRARYNADWKSAYEEQFPSALGEIMEQPLIKAQHSFRYEEETDRDLVSENKLVEDGKPVTFYHGTAHVDIQKWQTGHQTGLSSHNVISFSYDKEFASQWSNPGHMTMSRHPTVYITHIVAKNPADFRNPEHVQQAAEWLTGKRVKELSAHDLNKGSEYYGGKEAYIEHLRKGFVRALSAGNWQLWEDPKLWKAMGWDAAHMLENEGSRSLNISVANGNQIFFKYVNPVNAVRVKLHSDMRKLYPEAAGLPKTFFSKTGISADEAASLTGYNSGEALIRDLVKFEVDKGDMSFGQYLKKTVEANAFQRTLDQVGDILNDENIQREASEAFNAPMIEDLLWEQLKPLAEAVGRPLTKADVKELAEASFNKLQVKHALAIQAFEKQIYTLGNKTEVPLLKDKAQVAFVLKQRQLVAHYKLGLAHEFAKTYKAASKAMRRLADRPTSGSMDQEARNFARVIVQQLGFKVKTGKFESLEAALEGKTLSDYVREKWAEGYQIVDAELPAVPPKYPTDLSVDQFSGAWDMVQSVSEIGREAMKVERQGQKVALADTVGEVKTNADKVGRQYTAGELKKIEKTLTGKLSELARNNGSAIARPETYLYWLDGETNGPLMQSIVNPLQAGNYFKIDKMRELGEAWHTFAKAQPEGWRNSLEQAVDVPELLYSIDANGTPYQWVQTRGEVMMMASHFGSADNFRKLTEGFGWDPNTVRAVVDRILTKADWDYVQFILGQHKKLWPEVKQLYRDTVGLAPEEVKATPIKTKFGTYSGGYRHIAYDWSAVGEFRDENGNVKIVRDPNSLGVSDLFGSDFRVATPPNKYTVRRKTFSAPINLDHGILTHEFEAVVHDLAYRKALIQAAKVMAQPAVKQAFREALGPEYLKETNRWLQDVARQANYDQAQLSFWAAKVRGLRRAFTIYQIGWNVSTVAKHGAIALSHVQGEVGIADFAKAQADLLKSPEESQRLSAWVDSTSGAVRTAVQNYDRDVSMLITNDLREHGFVDGARYQAFTLFGLVKQFEARGTWLAKYRQLQAEGMSHEDSVELADKSVRDTQGAGSVVDLPALWRGGVDFAGELGQLLTNVFTSFENTVGNRSWTAIRQAKRGIKGFQEGDWQGGRRDFNKIWTSTWSFLAIPVMLATASDVLTQGGGDKFLKHFFERLAPNAVRGLLGGSILGGSIASDVLYAALAKDHSMGDSVIGGIIKDFLYTGDNAAKVAAGHTNKVDPKWVEHAVGALGVGASLPLKPLAKGGQYLWDISHGKDHPKDVADFARGLVYGPRPADMKR